MQRIMTTRWQISILTLFMFFTGLVSAEEPNVPTQPPYIVLEENLDEPNGYGFCLDTLGPGKSELMHAHSCKPQTPGDTPKNNSSHDVRFEYDSANKKIRSYAFEGQCMQVLISSKKSEFALLDCSDHPHQKFVYEQTDKTLRLEVDQSY